MSPKFIKVSSCLGLLVGSALWSASAGAGGWSSFNINDPHWFNTYWHPTPYNYQFDQLPLSGSTTNAHIPWSDSYWPSQLSGMAYRWKQNQKENEEHDLPPTELRERFFNVHRYSLNELRGMTRKKIAETLSPLEKYSVFIGDYTYAILKDYIKPDSSQDESWEGFCHAWAPAANHFTEPKPVTRKNRDGIIIDFGTADVKALLIANYDQTTDAPMKKLFGKMNRKDRKEYRMARREAHRRGKDLSREDFLGVNKKSTAADTPETPRFAFIGDRCGERFMFKEPKIKNGKEVFGDYINSNGMLETSYPEYLRKYQANAIRMGISDEEIDEDGGKPIRIWDADEEKMVPNPDFVAESIDLANSEGCDDTNAGAFHAVITNQLGILKEGFQFDKTRDVEVWNQPAYRFDSSVLGYEKPNPKTSTPGTVKVVVIKTRLYFGEDTNYGWAYWNSTLTSLFSPDKNFMDEYNRYSKLLINEGDATTPHQYPDGILDYADYQYKIDLDVYGQIIGGTWLTIDRPDFLWIMRKLPYMRNYKRLGEIYEAVKFPDDSVKPNLGD